MEKQFKDLSLSKETLKGLKRASYVDLSEIQRLSLPESLMGKDVLAAAKTGSGKTLAFLIPVLEVLKRQDWSKMDGLGGLIISPTRELALQIFQVLRKIGSFHSFSAGLLIGGKHLKEETGRVGRMNILVCTPGRLLQHMDENSEFSCDNLQVLVLDEADMVLDLGFEKTMNAIIENLPKQRQTLLFSATQTDSVKQLARLSLDNPTKISADAESATAFQDSATTPANLKQRYLVCDLDKKIDMFYSFFKSHLRAKLLVFVSSCKQVRFLYEALCKIQPGVQLLQLHGQQKQMQRINIFDLFCRKQHVCLIATDVAARGLDFPAVDWVIQLDCPANIDTYIHRVGRTARFDSKGDALTLLLPSEEAGMKALWAAKGIQADPIRANPKRQMSIKGALASICVQNPDIKYLGEKALISYVRSVYLNPDKTVFNVLELPLAAFASSLGLPSTPKIKFVNKLRLEKNRQRKLGHEVASNEVNDIHTDSETEHGKPAKRKIELDDSDDFLVMKRQNHELKESHMGLTDHLDESKLSKRQLQRMKQKELKIRGNNKHLVFSEDGKAVPTFMLQSVNDYIAESNFGTLEESAKHYISNQSSVMAKADAEDKDIEREKRKQKKLEKRAKLRAQRGTEKSHSVQLAAVESDSISESKVSANDDDFSDGYESVYENEIDLSE